MSAQRCIAHYDLDTFFVSVERLKNPKLNGLPLLVGGSQQRGVVSACSYEARKFGVHSAMPMHQAIKLCPEATVVKGSMESYSYYSHCVTAIIRQSMPVVQKASIDEFYIDMTGMDTFFGCFEYSRCLRQRILKETGLPVSFAIASTKLLSKIATNECKPNGEMQVLPGTESAFLSPLPIDKVPMVGQKSAQVLRTNGIYTIGDLISLSPKQALLLLGKNGLGLWNRVNGIGETVVKEHHQKKSISCENTFHNNTNDEVFLLHELVRLIERVGLELRNEQKQAACVGIKIKYDDFRVVIHQCGIEATAYDHVIINTVKELFYSLYQKGRMVRLIGVRLSNLTCSRQTNLFDFNTNQNKLYQELDGIKGKYGTKMISRASAVIAAKQDHAQPDQVLWFNRNV